MGVLRFTSHAESPVQYADATMENAKPGHSNVQPYPRNKNAPIVQALAPAKYNSVSRNCGAATRRSGRAAITRSPAQAPVGTSMN